MSDVSIVCCRPLPLRAARKGCSGSAARALAVETKFMPGPGRVFEVKVGDKSLPNTSEVISPAMQKSQWPLVLHDADCFEGIRLSSYDDGDGGLRKPAGAFKRATSTAPEPAFACNSPISGEKPTPAGQPALRPRAADGGTTGTQA